MFFIPKLMQKSCWFTTWKIFIPELGIMTSAIKYGPILYWILSLLMSFPNSLDNMQKWQNLQSHCLTIMLSFWLFKEFLMWTIFKAFIEFVTTLLLFLCFYFYFWLKGTWDLSSLIRDRTCTPCIGRQSLNYWTTRESLYLLFLMQLVIHFGHKP